jgi:integrase
MKYSVTLTGIPNFNEVISCVFEPLNSYKVQRLMDGLDLKTGADGRTRTLYSLRNFYATLNLERGISTHALSRQLGNSTEMIDRHYSKYSPLLNAEVHSGWKTKKPI